MDVVCAQQQIEIGARKRTDPALRHDEIVGVRREARINGAAVALKETLVR